MLGRVPDCSTHEKKHRLLKAGGLVDRQKGKLSAYTEMQASLGKRFLAHVIDQGLEFGLRAWGLDTPHAAPQVFKTGWDLPDLQTSVSATLGRVHVRQDSVLFCENTAVYVHHCFFSHAPGLFFEVQPLRRVQVHTWGSTWQREPGGRRVLRATPRAYDAPLWFRCVGQDIECLR